MKSVKINLVTFSYTAFFQLAITAPQLNLTGYNIATAQTHTTEISENKKLERTIFYAINGSA
jgi:hypothetical protein